MHNGYYRTYGGYRDWAGNYIKKTPDTHGYSYDPYVVYKNKQEYEHSVYSDRLFQWDSQKHDSLCKKHFGNQSSYWNNRSNDKIEAFLRDYFDKPNIKLVGVMQGCNVSSGYPYWIFMYDEN